MLQRKLTLIAEITVFVIIKNWDFSLPSIVFIFPFFSFSAPAISFLWGINEFFYISFLKLFENSRCHFHSFETFILKCTLLLYTCVYIFRGFPGGSDGKESACNARDQGLIPGLGGPPEEETATHSSILACRIPWTETLGGYRSWDRKELDSTERLTLPLSHIFCNKVYSYSVCLSSSQTWQRISQMLTTFIKE